MLMILLITYKHPLVYDVCASRHQMSHPLYQHVELHMSRASGMFHLESQLSVDCSSIVQLQRQR